MAHTSIGHTRAGSSLQSALKQEDFRRNLNDTPLGELIQQAKNMGVSHEVRDIANDLDSVRNAIGRKTRELEIIEGLALESDDQNIANLRGQLFTTVKLIHNDIINTMLDDYDQSERESPYPGDSCSTEEDRPMDKSTLMGRIRGFWRRRRMYRKQLKEIKEQLKNDIAYM